MASRLMKEVQTEVADRRPHSRRNRSACRTGMTAGWSASTRIVCMLGHSEKGTLECGGMALEERLLAVEGGRMSREDGRTDSLG